MVALHVGSVHFQPHFSNIYGVDALNPVQISAAEMDPSQLKAEFGDRLVFWGGAIDAQHVLPQADPATVREHVRRNT